MDVGVAGVRRAWSSLAACAVLASAGALPGAALQQKEEHSEPGELFALSLEGFVYTPDGSPAEGAVVVSGAGGKAVADVRGAYLLQAEVPFETESVQVTAVGADGRNFL